MTCYMQQVLVTLICVQFQDIKNKSHICKIEINLIKFKESIWPDLISDLYDIDKHGLKLKFLMA